jgi:hypothetical protein
VVETSNIGRSIGAKLIGANFGGTDLKGLCIIGKPLGGRGEVISILESMITRKHTTGHGRLFLLMP